MGGPFDFEPFQNRGFTDFVDAIDRIGGGDGFDLRKISVGSRAGDVTRHQQRIADAVLQTAQQRAQMIPFLSVHFVRECHIFPCKYFPAFCA